MSNLSWPHAKCNRRTDAQTQKSKPICPLNFEVGGIKNQEALFFLCLIIWGLMSQSTILRSSWDITFEFKRLLTDPRQIPNSSPARSFWLSFWQLCFKNTKPSHEGGGCHLAFDVRLYHHNERLLNDSQRLLNDSQKYNSAPTSGLR